MVIDRASVFADRFKNNPQILQAAVLGQAPVPGLDPYTALRAMQLLKESQQMQMAQAAQQPTQSPSLVQTAMQMPQMPPQMARPAPQQAAPQQAPMMAASGGLASFHVPDEDYAEGGIVAFADRGLVSDDEEGESNNPLLSALQAMESSPGDPNVYRQLTALYPGLIREAMKDAPPGMTAVERAQFVKDYIAERKLEAGPSPFGGLREEIATARGERDKNLRQAQGIALLEASAEALRPGGTMRGLAGAAAKFGGSYGQALQADRAERRALANMEMNIADAERKERMGLHSEARAAAAAADKDKVEAGRARTNKFNSLANLVGRGIQATKPTTGAGKTPSLPQVDRQLAQLRLQIVDLENKNPDDPKIPVLRQQAAALSEVLAASKDTGPVKAGLTEAELVRRIDEAVAVDANKFARMPSLSPIYKDELRAAKTALSQAQQTKDPELIAKRQAEVKAVIKKYEDDQREYYRKNPSLLMQTAAPASAASPAPSAIDFSKLPTAKP